MQSFEKLERPFGALLASLRLQPGYSTIAARVSRRVSDAIVRVMQTETDDADIERRVHDVLCNGIRLLHEVEQLREKEKNGDIVPGLETPRDWTANHDGYLRAMFSKLNKHCGATQVVAFLTSTNGIAILDSAGYRDVPLHDVIALLTHEPPPRPVRTRDESPQNDIPL